MYLSGRWSKMREIWQRYSTQKQDLGGGGWQQKCKTGDEHEAHFPIIFTYLFVVNTNSLI